MRQIGTLESSRAADLFVAWLIAEGIDAHAEYADGADAGPVEIWIKSEDQVARARQELDEFRRQPDAPKYAEGERRAAAVVLERMKKQRQSAQNRRPLPTVQRAGARVPLTRTLIILSGVVALLTDFGTKPERLVDLPAYRALAFTSVDGAVAEDLVRQHGAQSDSLAVRAASLNRGEIWRLVTPIFIHFGTIHLVFNMIWLWQLGRVVEQRYGTVWLGILVLFVAAASNLAQGIVPERLDGSSPVWTGGQLISLFGGMSGVVYGLFGFGWIKAAFDPASRLYMPPSTVVIMVVWLLLCMTPAAAHLTGYGRVANWAHGVGLVAGMLAAWAGMLTASGSRRQQAG